MRTFNYFYNSLAISKSEFLRSVPKDWESDMVEGEYSYGYYRAVKL